MNASTTTCPERQIRLSKPRPIERRDGCRDFQSHGLARPATKAAIRTRASPFIDARLLIPQGYASGSTTPARDNPLSSRWR